MSKKIFLAGDEWIIDELVEDLLSGKIVLPEIPGEYNVMSCLQNLKVQIPGIAVDNNKLPDYEKGMKIMVIRPFVRSAYEKILPVLNSGVLKDKWWEIWREFAVIYLSRI
jgi:hypothetical protein